MIEVRQLEAFIAVVREGGFGRAARRLHQGQPALSKQIQALEREIGVKLLVRGAGGVTPTQAGQRLKEMADHVVLYVDSIRPAVRETAEGVSGLVSVGVSPSLVPALAEYLISHLGTLYPLLTVKVVEVLPMFLSEWLELNKLDVGLLTHWPAEKFISNLDYFDIGVEDVLLVAAADSLPGSSTGNEPPADLVLQTLPLAVTPGFRLLVQERFDLDGLPQPLGPEIDSVHLIRELVLQGVACSALPFTYVREDLAAGRIVAANFSPNLRRELIAATQYGRRATPGVRCVVQAARTRLAELEQMRLGVKEAN